MNYSLTATAAYFLALLPLAQGQDFGPQKAISTGGTVLGVYATDLDGDGDADVLSAANDVVWNENLGGGNFEYYQALSGGSYGSQSVYATDLDGDGDADVLSAENAVKWSENLGGGIFGGKQVLTSSDNAHSVYASDLDGDGDPDVLSAFGNSVAWHENLGGGAFGSPSLIDVAIGSAGAQVYATDLDGDGDADVLSASAAENRIAWHENLGGGVFGAKQVITTKAFGVRSVFATDLDGDSDSDVLSASYDDDQIAWYENLGGGIFGPQQLVTTLADGALSVYATDLDGDGDADVLSASYYDGKIAWYENLGGGVFGTQQPIATVPPIDARCAFATDLDGDGDADVLSGGAWYENLMWQDCNANGTLDQLDISSGASSDCNANGIPDECDIGAGSEVDCDGNGVPDSCQFASNPASDLDGDIQLDVCQALYGDNVAVSWYFGGAQSLVINAGASQAGYVYFLLGTTLGDSPGIPLSSGDVLPLNIISMGGVLDFYFLHTLYNPGVFPLTGSYGVLGASGTATATFTWPPLLGASFIGLQVDHAYVVLDPVNGLVVGVSNSWPLLIAPF